MARPRKQTDDQLVAAAARVIGRRGPHGLTLADVADEAGLSPATLVQRFGSKRALLLAVAASGPETISGAFADARRRRRGAVAALEDALTTLAATIDDPDEVANHLAFLALDLADPEFRRHAERDVDAMREEIEALLKQAVVGEELDVRARRPLAEALQAAYHGTLLMWSIDRRGVPAARVKEQLRVVLRPYRRQG